VLLCFYAFEVLSYPQILQLSMVYALVNIMV